MAVSETKDKGESVVTGKTTVVVSKKSWWGCRYVSGLDFKDSKGRPVGVVGDGVS